MVYRSLVVNMIFTVIITVLLFAGCADDDSAKKGDDAELISLSIGDLTAAGIPDVISRTVWLNTSQSFENLSGGHTETLNFNSAYDYIAVTGTAKTSKNAAVDYAWTVESNARPRNFTGLNTRITPQRGSFLYVRVTSRSGNTINYYRFKIMSPPAAVAGVSIDNEPFTMTLFSKKQLTISFDPPIATNTNVTWKSSDNTIISVTQSGVVKALKFTEGGGSTDPAAAKGSAVITVKTEDGGFEDTIVVTASMEGTIAKLDLPSLKDQFNEYFLIGNIFDPYQVSLDAEITDAGLVRHYNVLTHQNNMKPSYFGNITTGTWPNTTTTSTRGVYNTTNLATAMRMIDAALAQDMKIVGHTLLWHSQSAAWMNSLRTSSDSKEDVLEWMKEYVTYIVSYYKGKIYSWDVLNEAFPDGVSAGAAWRNAFRNGESDGLMWYIKIGSDFVYEGYKAARLADPGAILYYNDYNLDSLGKSTIVHNMVRDVNERWLADPLYDGRLLIEGIGMQSHHNTGVTAQAIKATLDRFRPLGVKISISELDVLSQSYNDYSATTAQTGPTATNNQKLTAANLYGEYFTLFLENSDIIERVTWWGQSDNNSWRSRGLPLLFDNYVEDGYSFRRAKPAYYKVIDALESFRDKH